MALGMAAAGCGDHKRGAELLASVIDGRDCLGASAEQLDVLVEVSPTCDVAAYP